MIVQRWQPGEVSVVSDVEFVVIIKRCWAGVDNDRSVEGPTRRGFGKEGSMSMVQVVELAFRHWSNISVLVFHRFMTDKIIFVIALVMQKNMARRGFDSIYAKIILCTLIIFYAGQKASISFCSKRNNKAFCSAGGKTRFPKQNIQQKTDYTYIWSSFAMS